MGTRRKLCSRSSPGKVLEGRGFVAPDACQETRAPLQAQPLPALGRHFWVQSPNPVGWSLLRGGGCASRGSRNSPWGSHPCFSGRAPQGSAHGQPREHRASEEPLRSSRCSPVPPGSGAARLPRAVWGWPWGCAVRCRRLQGSPSRPRRGPGAAAGAGHRGRRRGGGRAVRRGPGSPAGHPQHPAEGVQLPPRRHQVSPAGPPPRPLLGPAATGQGVAVLSRKGADLDGV